MSAIPIREACAAEMTRLTDAAYEAHPHMVVFHDGRATISADEYRMLVDEAAHMRALLSDPLDECRGRACKTAIALRDLLREVAELSAGEIGIRDRAGELSSVLECLPDDLRARVEKVVKQ